MMLPSINESESDRDDVSGKNSKWCYMLPTSITPRMYSWSVNLKHKKK